MSGTTADVSRRDFLKTTSGAVAAAAIGPVVLQQSARGANERLRVAVLGVNGRGTAHIEGFMEQENVEVAVLCDPDLAVAGKRQAEFEKKYGKKPEIVQDLRKVFEDKNIDAVSIATPNHWHSLAAIWAMQAGKDVYVEKPGSHTVWEGR